ncbi:MAG: ABC transporter permease [Comamonadaceae bacterium]|nr:ABC transporter permease [Comamonadaceae bacterium]
MREPQAFFFTLFLPLVLLFVYGGIHGNAPKAMYGGFGTVDVSVPSYTAMIIATSGLISIPVIIATYRESGVLEAVQGDPPRADDPAGGRCCCDLRDDDLGHAAPDRERQDSSFGLRFTGNILSLALAFSLSCLSFFSLGFVLSGLLRTARTAQIVGMTLFFPMVMLSGAAIPLETMPESIRVYSNVLPLTYVVKLLKGLWFGGTWAEHGTEVLVLAGLFVLGLVVTAKTFRWD